MKRSFVFLVSVAACGRVWAEFRPRGERALVSFTGNVVEKGAGGAAMSMEDHTQHAH